MALATTRIKKVSFILPLSEESFLPRRPARLWEMLLAWVSVGSAATLCGEAARPTAPAVTPALATLAPPRRVAADLEQWELRDGRMRVHGYRGDRPEPAGALHR